MPLTLALAPAGGAHVVHYGIVIVGLTGLALLLVPAHAARWLPPPPPDEHELRVRELRARIAHGTLAAPRTDVRRPRPEAARALALPVAVVGSLAAAGVHAAVGPRHLRDGLLVGGLFLAVALAQLAWAAVARTGAGDRVLVAGAVGNAAVLAAWLMSRTVGVPGLVPTPEPFGAWDLAAAGWELAVVGACVRLLGSAGRVGVPGRAWHPAAVAWLAASVVVLGVLSVSGAPA